MSLLLYSLCYNIYRSSNLELNGDHTVRPIGFVIFGLWQLATQADWKMALYLKRRELMENNLLKLLQMKVGQLDYCISLYVVYCIC